MATGDYPHTGDHPDLVTFNDTHLCTTECVTLQETMQKLNDTIAATFTTPDRVLTDSVKEDGWDVREILDDYTKVTHIHSKELRNLHELLDGLRLTVSSGLTKRVEELEQGILQDGFSEDIATELFKRVVSLEDTDNQRLRNLEQANAEAHDLIGDLTRQIRDLQTLPYQPYIPPYQPVQPYPTPWQQPTTTWDTTNYISHTDPDPQKYPELVKDCCKEN